MSDSPPSRHADFLNSPLAKLASRVGIELEYVNAAKQTIAIAPEVVRAILAAMNLPAESDEEAGNRLNELDAEDASRRLPPVMVVRNDQQPLRIPLNFYHRGSPLSWRLLLEDGSIIEGAEPKSTPEPDIPELGLDSLTIEHHLPLGYHRLEVDQLNARMWLIIAPRQCWMPPELERGKKIWGLATQLYLLRSENNWGIGDFRDLRRLIEIAAGWGAALIGLNPLHALFLDEPSHASPYSPASRLFLNVLNIDITAVPEFADSSASRRMLENESFKAALEKARDAALLDYETVAKLKLDALRSLFKIFQHEQSPERWRAFDQFRLSAGPALEQFCTFQALRFAQARKGASADWRQWPEDLRSFDSPLVARFAADHRDEIDFFAWTQWLAETQLADAAAAARQSGMAVGLYRDLAVGADAAGAETWSQPGIVVARAHVGAPPDLLNTRGQDWGLPPFDPRRLRENGYAAFIALVRANMRHAGALRIDHVVGLLHLYWIPEGHPPSEGAYVGYPFDDLTGILALESQRNRCVVVGEDLGTVPPDFRDKMADLGILSYKVLYFEQKAASDSFILPEDYPLLSLATVGSHDLATLRGWWQLHDIELREKLRLYPDPAEGRRQRDIRDGEKRHLLQALEAEGLDPGNGGDFERLARAVHVFLGRTNAVIAMLRLENLLGELAQVNLPATTDQHTNWRRRLRAKLEACVTDPQVRAIVESMASGRKAANGRS